MADEDVPRGYIIIRDQKQDYLSQAIEHNYDNIKFADTKAGALIGGIVLLISFLSTKEGGFSAVWGAESPLILFVGRVTILGFLVSLLVCVWFTFWVIVPRYRLPASWEEPPEGEEDGREGSGRAVGQGKRWRPFHPPRLFWAKNVIEYTDPAAYFRAVERLPEEDILQDLTHEQYKLCAILDEKLKQLGRAIKGFSVMFVCWAILVGLIWLAV
jgi:hypothetical protein